jgi:hypothetical protein
LEVLNIDANFENLFLNIPIEINILIEEIAITRYQLEKQTYVNKSKF